ncbi:MAG: FtsX-like permease family protein [Cytophagales bacterium]|nr:FtsX-like permease family protein [Cytophagales bacterium]
MFKSYFLIGLRSATRNMATTLINVLGLGLGIGVAITVFIFNDFMLHMDGFHANKESVYQVISHVKEGNSQVRPWGDSPVMLGPALKADQAAIESSVRIEFSGGSVRNNDVVFSEGIWFVDPEFLTMFSFPLLQGNKGVLTNKKNVVLTRLLSEKYFGQEDAIGQVLSIKFSNGKKEEFIVSAVVDIPENSSIHPPILLSMEMFEQLKFRDSYDWSYLTDALFIKLKPGQTVEEIKPVMSKYLTLQNTSSPEWLVEDFEFVKLSTLANHSDEIVSSVSHSADPSAIITLTTIAVMLLLLACFNYMNVSIATVTTRLKEIGIRKVTGGRRSEIIQQFLVENLALCAFALFLGTAFTYTFLLPGFNSLYPFTLPFTFSSGTVAYAFFFSLLALVTLVSGAYPAVYVSSFTPINILRGREKFGQRSLFSRILLTMQFILAFTTIVGSFVFIDNAIYLGKKDWGYDHRQTLAVPVSNNTQFLALRDKVVTNENVMELAGARDHVGYSNRYVSFEHLGHRFVMVPHRVGFGYLETMNIQLKAGRFFTREIQSDAVESAVVNEFFAKQMGWSDPLNREFEYEGIKRYVIGVVKDFHHEGFYDPIQPVLFTVCPEEDFRYLTMKVKPGKVEESEDLVQATWKQVAPDDPYEGFPQERVMEDFYQDNRANVKLIGFVAAMAVILACLGLFGLVSYNITRRLKEFSIRKVFGASITQIFRLMNQDYSWMLLTSFLIGAPAGYYLINMLIQKIYPEPQGASAGPFVFAIALMAITVAITIGSQLGRILRENPTETLRND